MTNVTLTAQQRTGIERIVHWFRDETRQQQVARIFGYAGCGKSTLLRYLVNELGLAPMTPGGLGGVLFAAFTGKAALVMTPQRHARADHSQPDLSPL
jgi:exodeoxyribonuclease-5